MNTYKPNDFLGRKSYLFAVRIVKFSRILQEKKEFVLAKQILRSGTNPGAMVREARNAESGKDFIHKLSIAQKETGETMYWLELLYDSEIISEKEFKSLHKDAEEILKLLTSSIKPKKRNLHTKTFLLCILLCFMIANMV